MAGPGEISLAMVLLQNQTGNLSAASPFPLPSPGLVKSCSLAKLLSNVSEGICLDQHVCFQEDCQEHCTLALLFYAGREQLDSPFAFCFVLLFKQPFALTDVKKKKKILKGESPREFGLHINKTQLAQQRNPPTKTQT